MNKVEKEFIDKNRVIMRPNGKWLVMTKKNAIEFIESCEKEKIGILGIDGFYLHQPKGIEPSMDNSIDFSSASFKGDKNNIYEEAKQFIHTRDDNLYFEVVCTED